MEKNYPLPALQELINKLNGTNYNVIISRTSSWKGTPLPFFLQGKYYDLVDRPIKEVMNVLNCCDYFIGIDSAFSHIAYHLNKPRMVLQYNQNPYHVVRYHENLNHDLPLNVSPDHIFNRVMLNLKDPLTQALPAYMNIPYQTNTKQLLFKKYYD
jgi:ADP-heptose:LPS heptosyltransferase